MKNLANLAFNMYPTINKRDNATILAQSILSIVLKHRRMVDSTCNSTCPSCQEVHIDKIIEAIREHRPIYFVLPAFPGKSPNLNKVLGHLPDTAEVEALKFLNTLCDEIKTIYNPGMKIIICSDGRVFSDIIGIKEEHVTEYQIEIDRIISENNLNNLTTFNLDEVAQERSFDQLREELMQAYGTSLESLREKIKKGGKGSLDHEDIEANRMYCGLTRFLFEDALVPGFTETRSSLQRQAKKKAYEVIRRSNAWTEFIADVFPRAVRLSIHPQACGSKKIGIQLLGVETWMTPWHGVAVKVNGEFQLMKRFQAEELEAVLISDSMGNPSHFEMGGSHVL